MTDFALSFDGNRIAYQTHGTGTPALVFVHGWSCDRTYWKRQVSVFAAAHRVVSVDLAGHGESTDDRSAWTMPSFGDDVVAVVDQLGLEALVFIGHSMGGDVIVDAALKLGARVAGLVWVDVYSELGEPRAPKEIDEFLVPFHDQFAATTDRFVRGMFVPTSDPVLVDWVATDMSAAAPQIALGAMRHAISNEVPILDGLSQLQIPKVAINPDYRPTDVESLARYGVKAVLMPGVGHFLMMEDPEGFNRLLTEAIEGFER